MDTYAKLVESIITQQERIIGPLAVEQASHVSGLHLDWAQHTVTMEGNRSEVVERLIEQYQALFGQTSVEVCKEAALPYLPQLGADVPELLR